MGMGYMGGRVYVVCSSLFQTTSRRRFISYYVGIIRIRGIFHCY